MKRSSKKFHAKKIARLALLTALALLTFMIEGLFPPILIPSAKPGLSNVFSLLALVFYGLPEALLIVTVRTVLGSIFAGNLSLLLYSFTAGIISVIAERIFFFAFPKISVVAISVLAAVVHNGVQCLVYALLSGTAFVFSYLPYLTLLGVLSGTIVGLTVIFTVKALPFTVTGIAKKERAF